MTPPPSSRFYVIAISLVVGLILVLTPIVIAYCRLIFCKWCHEPFAIYPRTIGDLCTSCAGIFDHQLARVGRRRSLLRRLFRAAA